MFLLNLFELWHHQSWTNFSQQDGTWAEFSSLDSAVFAQAMICTHFVKRPNLKLKTRPKQLLGSLR